MLLTPLSHGPQPTALAAEPCAKQHREHLGR